MTNSKTTDVGGIPAKDNVLIIALKQLHSALPYYDTTTTLALLTRSLALFF